MTTRIRKTTLRPQVELRFIRVGDMTPDHQFQRDRKAAKIRALAEDWDDTKVGACIVNIRTDGSIVISDGGHRWEAAKERFGEDYELPCVVNTGLDAQGESDVFLKVNRNRTNVSAWDQFRVALNGELHPFVDIEATLQEQGLGVAQKASPNRIGAIQALMRIVPEDTDTADLPTRLHILATTVALLRAGLPALASTWDADMLQAVARIVERNSHKLDHDRLTSVLVKQSVGMWKNAAITAHMEAKKKDGIEAGWSSGGSESRSMILNKYIVATYNSRLDKAKRIV